VSTPRLVCSHTVATLMAGRSQKRIPQNVPHVSGLTRIPCPSCSLEAWPCRFVNAPMLA
jgi:hypothetical protein